MPLLSLPNELLYMVAKDLLPDTLDLSSFSRTNRHLNTLLTPLLIRKCGPDNALVFASQRGFVSQARDALALGADVEAVDWDFGCPALQWAAKGGHNLVTILLLQHGADTTNEDECERTALHWAAAAGGRNDLVWVLPGVNGQSGVIRITCGTGDRRSDTGSERSNSLGAPHKILGMEHEAVARLLLDNGADINAKDQDERTALSVAVQSGHGGIVKLLLERGADISFGSVSWLQSLAAGSNEEMIFRLLMERDSCSTTTRIPDSELSTPFLKAVASGNEQAVKFLLERGVAISAADEWTDDNALIVAVTEGHVNMAILLLDEGLDINMTDKKRRTLLHLTSCSEMMTLLLERGLDVHARDSSKQTPLHTLTRLKVVPAVITCINLLLAKGAYIEARDIYGRTPLHRAVICSTLEVVKLLLQNKACIAYKDDDGLTALHWAAMARRPDVVRLLIDAGADIAVRSHNCRTLLHEIIHLSKVEMKDCYNEENVWDWDSYTTGSYQDSSSNVEQNMRERATWEEMVKLLLDLGANAFAVDGTGYPPYKAARAAQWRSMSDIITKYCPPKKLPDNRLTCSFNIHQWHQSNSGV